MPTYPDPQHNDFPKWARVKIAGIEEELDGLWVGWRNHVRFDHLQYEQKARLKYLLKRHSLLTHREGRVPAPRDWEVLIARDARNPNLCYAHPVLPATEAGAGSVTRQGDPGPSVIGEVTSEPPPEAPMNLATLAFEWKRPIEVLERLHASRPNGDADQLKRDVDFYFSPEGQALLEPAPQPDTVSPAPTKGKRGPSASKSKRTPRP